MDKKGNLKGVLIFFVIWIGGVSLFWFFFIHSMGLVKLNVSCPKNLIPDRFLLEPYQEGNMNTVHCACKKDGAGFCYECLQKWGDGTKIRGILMCQKGNSAGQNVNYYYCNKDYKKTPVSSEGVVGKTLDIMIYLVIDSNDKTNEGYKVVDYTCKG